MLPNCGNGRSSWPRAIVALRRELPAAGDAEERVRHLRQRVVAGQAWYFGSSWLMLISAFARSAPAQVAAGEAGVAEPTGSCRRGSSRCRSTEYCCTRGAPLFGSTKLMSPPTPVSRPSVLPLGCTSPFGNGLLIVTVGTLHVDCCTIGRRRVADLGPAVVPAAG